MKGTHDRRFAALIGRAASRPCTWSPANPFTQLAAGVHTKDQAQFWVDLFKVVRLFLRGDAAAQIALGRIWADAGERHMLRNLRMVERSPALRDDALRRIDGFVLGLRTEWDLS